MSRRFSRSELMQLRNSIAIREVVEKILGLEKRITGSRYRFRCPLCSELCCGIDRRTNLSRCFECERNFNTIELVMVSLNKSFVQSVKLLKHWQQTSTRPVAYSPTTASDSSELTSAATILERFIIINNKAA